MEKLSSFPSALMLFIWVFLFLAVSFCYANSASSATEAFPEHEVNPINGNMENIGLEGHIEEDKFKAFEKPFYKKPLPPRPKILKQPFIKAPHKISNIKRLSSKPSIPIVEKPHFLLIPFFKNLFPIVKKPEHVPIPQFKKPILKPNPCLKNSKPLPIPEFQKPNPEPTPIVGKPIPESQKHIPEPISEEKKPIPEYEKPIPISFFPPPIPAIDTESPKPKNPLFKKPSPRIPFPPTSKITIPIQKSNTEFQNPVSEPIPMVKKPILDYEKPLTISDKHFLPSLVPTGMPESLKPEEFLFKKPIPKIPLLPIPKKTFPIQKPNPEFLKPILKPIPMIKKPIPEYEKPLPISNNYFLPSPAPIGEPESLMLKKPLFKKPIPKIPPPSKFQKPLPIQKPIPPP